MSKKRFESTFDCYKDYIENTKKFKDVIDNLKLFITAYKKAGKPTAKAAKRYLQEINDILDKYTERNNHVD